MGGEFQGAVLLFCDDEDLAAKGPVGMVVDALGVESLALDSDFKMQMVGRGTACASFYADGVARVQPLPYLDEVAGMVAIERLKSIGVPQDDAIPVAVVRSGENHFAWKSGAGGVARKSLDVCTSMMAVSSEWTNDLASRKRIAPFLYGIVGEVDGELVAVSEGVLRRCNLHHLPLVDVGKVVLSIYKRIS